MRAYLLGALALAIAATASGCVGSPDDVRIGSNSPSDEVRTLRADDAPEATSAPSEGENLPDVCAQIVDTEGPCALACDPDTAVEDWLPAHTCVALVCELADGSHAMLHACRDD